MYACTLVLRGLPDIMIIPRHHACTDKIKQTARLLRKVGKKLAAVAGCEDLPWEFHVIDEDAIMNAAAMPGGKVVVFTGLKQCVTTEEELAAVVREGRPETDWID